MESRGALQLMMDAVHRYDSHVTQALGDGIFAPLGAPIAHEDHPQRALYAALWMLEEMQGMEIRSDCNMACPSRCGCVSKRAKSSCVRFGKDDLHRDYVPVGHSTNLAARMAQ